MPGSAAGGRSVIIALAPLARACAAKASPWVCRPGIAKNTSPGLIARESALTPSTFSRGGLLPVPFSNSGSTNDTGGSSSIALVEFRGNKFGIQHWIKIGTDSKHRRYPGDDAARCLAGVPARCVATLPRLGVRIVDQDNHGVARLIEREHRGEQ